MRTQHIWRTIIVIVLATTALAACDPTNPPPPPQPVPTVSIAQISPGPGYALRHDWSPAIAIESGQTNSCVTRTSSVSGRGHLCRVIDGYEQRPGSPDNRDWKVTFSGGAAPLYTSGSDIDQYGQMIVVSQGGQTFEGCDWQSPDNSYLCDYQARKQVVLNTSTNAYTFVLNKLWNWLGTQGNAVGCAGAIAGVWYGNPVTLGLLTDCLDGPYNGK